MRWVTRRLASWRDTPIIIRTRSICTPGAQQHHSNDWQHLKTSCEYNWENLPFNLSYVLFSHLLRNACWGLDVIVFICSDLDSLQTEVLSLDLRKSCTASMINCMSSFEPWSSADSLEVLICGFGHIFIPGRIFLNRMWAQDQSASLHYL